MPIWPLPHCIAPVLRPSGRPIHVLREKRPQNRGARLYHRKVRTTRAAQIVGLGPAGFKPKGAGGYFSDKPLKVAGSACGAARTSAAFAKIESNDAAGLAEYHASLTRPFARATCTRMKENSEIWVSPTPTSIAVVSGYRNSLTTAVQTMNFSHHHQWLAQLPRERAARDRGDEDIGQLFENFVMRRHEDNYRTAYYRVLIEGWRCSGWVNASSVCFCLRTTLNANPPALQPLSRQNCRVPLL